MLAIPKEFSGLGLRGPMVPKRRRLVLTVEGETGCGKSHLTLDTAPRPLLHINLDRNIEGIEERYVGQDIHIMEIEMPERINMDADLKEFQRIRNTIVTSIEKNYYRTVCVDTGDALWELCRRGFIGSLDFGGGKQQDYAEPNGAMRRIYRTAKSHKDVNLIVTHRMTDERIDKITADNKKTSIATGNRMMAGWKHTKWEAQCHVRLAEESNFVCGKSQCKKGCVNPYMHGIGRFTCTIMKCTANQALKGEVLRGAEISFPALGMLVFPMTAETPEVWE